MNVYGHSVSDIYCYGVIGSIGVELGAALTAASAAEGFLPAKYRRPAFVGLRFLFAFIAGTIPLALDATNMWNAIYLGASAPLIFDRAARGLDPAGKKEAA